MSEVAPLALVVAHGDLAAGLVSAVDAITGQAVLLDALSNREFGREELEAAILARVDRHAFRVIFTDLPAGSCAIAALRVARARPGVQVVTGVSLPVLLHFCGHAVEPDAPARAVERGLSALRVQPEAARAG